MAITGGATATGSGIQKVEVSTDGGTTWKPANGTILWSYSWTAPENGTYVIKSRATDNVGNVENPRRRGGVIGRALSTYFRGCKWKTTPR